MLLLKLYSVRVNQEGEVYGAAVKPGEEQEEQSLSGGRLVACAEVGVYLQCEEHQPEAHEENRQNQLIPQRHAQSQQTIDLHHLHNTGNQTFNDWRAG